MFSGVQASDPVSEEDRRNSETYESGEVSKDEQGDNEMDVEYGRSNIEIDPEQDGSDIEMVLESDGIDIDIGSEPDRIDNSVVTVAQVRCNTIYQEVYARLQKRHVSHFTDALVTY